MKRFACILFLFASAGRFAWGDPASDALFHQADDFEKAGKWDDAVNCYEQILTNGNSTDLGAWSSAQSRIVDALVKKKDFAAAAQQAHVWLDTSTNLQSFDDAVRMTANILSAQDKNVDRANQFLAFEQSGPVGGKTNPMDAVGYPSMPDREAAFAIIRQKAGEDADGSRLRAYTYLFSGKPRDALAQFSDAFRRNTNLYDFTNGGQELVVVGLRAARGQRVGLDKAMQFVIHGPNGPDGKPNTADDIPDPFAQLMPAPPPPGQGGLAGTDPASLDALRKVHDAAMLYAGDPLTPIDMNRCLGVMERCNVALDNWGAPGQKEWYLRLEFGQGCALPNPYTSGYLTGLFFNARGRANNYGDIPALWHEIDAYCAAHKVKELPGPQNETFKRIQQQFGNGADNMTHALQFPAPVFQPLKAPANF